MLHPPLLTRKHTHDKLFFQSGPWQSGEGNGGQGSGLDGRGGDSVGKFRDPLRGVLMGGRHESDSVDASLQKEGTGRGRARGRCT
jgi:hypothetical protein